MLSIVNRDEAKTQKFRLSREPIQTIPLTDKIVPKLFPFDLSGVAIAEGFATAGLHERDHDCERRRGMQS